MDRDEFLTAVLRNPNNEIIARELFELALPDAWLVSGCLVQTVWNGLTGRAVDHGISDYDVFYFDADSSWAAEDAVIRRIEQRLGGLGVTIEVRNQARVHLWYPQKHGVPYPELACAAEGIDRFLTRKYPSGNPPHVGRLRRLCALRSRRYRTPDRAAKSGSELFAGELCREGGKVEDVLAGGYGDGGRSNGVAVIASHPVGAKRRRMTRNDGGSIVISATAPRPT
jgi:hypothetical protein